MINLYHTTRRLHETKRHAEYARFCSGKYDSSFLALLGAFFGARGNLAQENPPTRTSVHDHPEIECSANCLRLPFYFTTHTPRVCAAGPFALPKVVRSRKPMRALIWTHTHHMQIGWLLPFGSHTLFAFQMSARICVPAAIKRWWFAFIAVRLFS